MGGCAEAGTVFPSKELLELHLQSHTGEVLSCHFVQYPLAIVLPFCPKKWPNNPPSRQSCHPCSHCPRVFPTAGRRSRHEATHDGDDGEELHSCPHCGEQQPSRLVLNMHTRYLKHSNWSNKEHEQASKYDISTLISHARYCRARDEEYTVVVEEERVELGAQSMVLTLEKDDLLVYQMNQQWLPLVCSNKSSLRPHAIN